MRVKATIIGMLVCIVAAAVVMVAVALPRLRQGARVLTPAGREQVTDARRRAMALAAQARERAAVVAEQAKERAAREEADEPEPVGGQIGSGSSDLVDVREAEVVRVGGEAVGRTRTLPSIAVPDPSSRERHRPVAGVIPGVSPRAPHRMSSWNPASTGPRHAR